MKRFFAIIILIPLLGVSQNCDYFNSLQWEKENVYQILVNKNNELLINNSPVIITGLTSSIRKFLIGKIDFILKNKDAQNIFFTIQSKGSKSIDSIIIQSILNEYIIINQTYNVSIDANNHICYNNAKSIQSSPQPPPSPKQYHKTRVIKTGSNEVEEVFVMVEQMPEFPGGQAALMQYIARNTQYPPLAKENGITGKVFIKFTVEKDGSVSNVQAIRRSGKPVHEILEEEAIRVVESLPNFKPGIQKGRYVRVEFTIPINFNL